MTHSYLSKEVLQEPETVRRAPALLILLVVVAVGVGAVLLMWLYLGRMDARLLRPEVPAQVTHMGAEKSGVEQSLISINRRAQDLGAEQEARLRSWGWVDRNKGTVHIPIESAFDLMLQEKAR
jgi:hypothetical protein